MPGNHRRTLSIGRRFTTCSKAIFILLAGFWLVGRAFIIMCRWSEEPTFGTCSGIVDHMCAEYSRSRLTGSMCLELCQNTSAERFQCKHVTGSGKKIIYFSRDENSKLVLKTKSFVFHELQAGHQNILRDSMAQGSLATTLMFLRRISKQHFVTNETFNRFVSHLDLHRHNAVAAVASGESLLQQEEYISINNLQSTGIVPRLHGTCGNFYAVDYLPSDDTLVRMKGFTAGLPWTSVGAWEGRRTASIALIELAERLEQHGRMLCDVRSENFGWLDGGKIGLVDLDSVFTKGELAGILKNDTCRRDSDCSLLDCHGSCNRTSRRCNADVSNTNFHAICSKIFRHHVSNALHGVLEDVPAKHMNTLDRLLSLCSSWKMSPRESKYALNEIRKVLLHDQILG
ncbi:divergent protein kinase domain 1C-like [Watersipora subatra]|uniref:divergent protein kinase domain 1C-like n=1 Tax=Watersipora subatra TaxID=2589382 RepID=UPI00355BE61E